MNMKDIMNLFSDFKKTSEGKFYIVDGHSYIYRSFYGIRNLSNSKGMMTNAIYGFTNMILKLIREEKPDYLACIFDLPAPTWREKEYEEYKIHREKMPDELKKQIPYIKEILSGFKISIFELEGFEADDIIGTMAMKISETGMKVVITSSDKDILQLVDDNIKVMNDRSEKIYCDRDAVIKKMGVPPENIPDFLAICGDSSDNIPGIKGIGEKGALSLIKEFKTIDNLLKNTDGIKNERYKKAVISDKDSAILSKKLATIKTDVPFDFDIETCKLKEFNKEKLQKLFQELEFKSFLKEITGVL